MQAEHPAALPLYGHRESGHSYKVRFARRFAPDDYTADFALCGYLFRADQARLPVPPYVATVRAGRDAAGASAMHANCGRAPPRTWRRSCNGSARPHPWGMG